MRLDRHFQKELRTGGEQREEVEHRRDSFAGAAAFGVLPAPGTEITRRLDPRGARGVEYNPERSGGRIIGNPLHNPERWQTDGRLYPPLPDSRRPVPGYPDVTRWRSKGHNTYIRENGAMEIVTVREGEIVFRAPGRDGRGVWDD